MKKKVVVILFILIIVILSFLFIKDDNETIIYKNKTYKLLEYNSDVFTYNFNNSKNRYLEVDVIHPIKHDKFDIVYFNGDLFVLDKQVDSAIKYYSNDKNYNWYVVFDIDDEIIRKDILLSKEDIKYLYKLEDAKKSKTIVFDDINMFCDIVKISKDGIVQGLIVLAKVDDNWYYKTEVMTDDDQEYVIKLSNSLSEKINDLIVNL